MLCKAATQLGQVKRDLAEIKRLKELIRTTRNQSVCDAAIVEFTHVTDRLLDALWQLNDAGLLDGCGRCGKGSAE